MMAFDHGSQANSANDGQNRRGFLTLSAAAIGSAAIANTFQAFLAKAAEPSKRKPGFGPLKPARDETTGLPLIELPEGFRYISFGWTKDRMSDGVPTPREHDGMAVIAEKDGVVTLCRNHEIEYGNTPFTTREKVYDSTSGAGCTMLEFDGNRGEWKKAWGAISGTVRNCAGGPTPWNSWLTCEETVSGPGYKKHGYSEHHGWIFEVPAEGPVDPKPLKDMGRFVHEAVAVDPETGCVYETEDRKTAGFYRFTPKVKGKLSQGGKLQMLKADNAPDLRRGSKTGQTYDVSWVDIPDPTGDSVGIFKDGKYDELAIFKQGRKENATVFDRLEGCWYGNGLIYFVSTEGGMKKSGQLWAFDPKQQTLKLVFESPSKDVLHMPDNIAVGPSGAIAMCEDGGVVPQRLFIMSPGGDLFPLAINNTRLNREKNGFRGDFRKVEWCGATFSSDGKWLFANLQSPGLTLAITGPWDAAGI